MNGVCQCCGYCPTCGWRRQLGNYQPYPYYQPWPYYQPGFWYGNMQGGTNTAALGTVTVSSGMIPPDPKKEYWPLDPSDNRPIS